ncbi:MAG TPA: DUF58 domain-containing protein [bacterium]|nr:DUF58 domain-containing protein [bacterium]
MAAEKSYLKYLRPDVVSRLSRLDLVARLVVEGFITGLHKSPYHGFSVEFSEYRPCVPGDTFRNIDWKVLGRTERYFVKQFEEETNLKAYLLLDTSGSMGYASKDLSKLRYAVYLAAALAYLMLVQRDAVGLITFDTRIATYLPPRSVSSYLPLLLKTMDGLEPGGETGLAATFHDLAERIKRRGLIIVFSDLMDDPDALLGALKHFRHRKHEVIVFHILDPMEQRFSFEGDSLFVDMESGRHIRTDAWQIRAAYQDALAAWQDRFKKECRASRIDYVPLETTQDYDRALMQYLAMRKRIGG